MGKRHAIALNCVCVLPEFRCAPETKQPGGMTDVYDTVKYLYQNAEQYGIDANKICLSGSSGGAH